MDANPINIILEFLYQEEKRQLLIAGIDPNAPTFGVGDEEKTLVYRNFAERLVEALSPAFSESYEDGYGAGCNTMSGQG